MPFLHVDLVTGVSSAKALHVTADLSEALSGNGKQQIRLVHVVQYA